MTTTPRATLSSATQAGGGEPPVGPGPSSTGSVVTQRRPRIGARVVAAVQDSAYVFAVFTWSIVAFTILVTGLAVTASLLAFVVGVVAWVAFVYLTRWTTWVDRTLAGWQRGQRISASYRRSPVPGVLPFLRNLTTDPQTWRDLAWLAMTSVVGFASGVVVITAAGVAGAYVSMPLWYWTITDPTAHRGLTYVGVFTVDSLGRALVMTMVGLVLIPVGLALARGCARLHSRLAVLLLGPTSAVSSTLRGGSAASG